MMISSSAFAIDEITEEDNGYHPYKEVQNYAEPNTFWSMYLDLGFTHFNGDRGAKLFGPDAKYAYSPDFGLGLEYSFTPCWGVWVDYHTTTYGQHMFDKSVDYDASTSGRFMGQMNTLGTGLSYNLLNGFFPRRTQTWLNLYLQVGGGMGVYSLHGAGFDYKTVGSDGDKILVQPTEITNSEGQIVGAWYNADKDKWTLADGTTDYSIKHYNVAGFIHVGFLLQFNVTRSFEIGLRPYYDFFTSDRVDGNANLLNPNNKMNDGLIGMDVQFRWAFGAKADSHTRNYANVDRFDKGIADRNEAARRDEILGKLDSLKNALDSLKNLPLLANNGGDTIINNNYAEAGTSTAYEDIYFVYFPNDVYELDEDGHIRVLEMAERLNMWPDTYLELRGYADATSNKAHNEWLSWNRTQTVRNELINLYGINPDRLIDRGVGQLDNVSGSFRANRRVTMRLVPEESVDSIREDRDNAHEQFRKNNSEATGEYKQSARTQALNNETAESTNTPFRAAPYGTDERKKTDSIEAKQAEERAAIRAAKLAELQAAAEQLLKQKAAEEKEKEADIICVVPADATLAQLADKYYNNPKCWVYIFEANRDILKSPDAIFEGQKLRIPSLTDEEKANASKHAIEMLQKLK